MRTKLLTSAVYSPTNPASEAAIRQQIDDSIQEVYDAAAKPADTVNLVGNQTVEGIKDFVSSPIVPAPTTDLQASTKKYVDDGLLANKNSDHLGTWQGYTPTLADPGISSVVAEHTVQLNGTSVSVDNFPVIVPESDDTGRVQRAIDTGKNVLFSQGETYICSTLTLVGNQSLFGYNSTIEFKTGATGSLIDILGVSNIDIIGLTLDGGNVTDYTLASVKGSRKGINIIGDAIKSINIDKCKIKGFDSDGIYMSALGYLFGHGRSVKVSNTDITLCYNGLNVAFRAEYCHFVNVSSTKARVAMRVEAANTFATNVHCSDSVDGLHLLLETAGNDSHSGFANCSFNHNSNFSIYAKDFTIGISMIGCHVHASGIISLENCSGFRFHSGQIRDTNIRLSGGGYNSFTNNLVNNAVAVTHNYGGFVDKTEFVNNISPNSTILPDVLLNFTNYYIDRTVSSAVSGITTEVTVVFNNQLIQLLFGQTNATLYDGTTGIGTIPQRGIYNILPNIAVTNPGGTDNAIELDIYRNATRIKRSTFIIKAGQTQFLESFVSSLFNAADTFKVTIKANTGTINLLAASEAHLFVNRMV